MTTTASSGEQMSVLNEALRSSLVFCFFKIRSVLSAFHTTA